MSINWSQPIELVIECDMTGTVAYPARLLGKLRGQSVAPYIVAYDDGDKEQFLCLEESGTRVEHHVLTVTRTVRNVASKPTTLGGLYRIFNERLRRANAEAA